ncbi:MAG: alpha-ketoacid dehydrogenase subunit beta [Chloroflexi bacterium]|nr:alpha-ketoacid dehydrogenase subunit beta [Chloroflexota bacterium]MBV9602024.1 alpha-ketoacid dehydrogenase subunit beta [Chloroflexota bacterium]
MTGLLMVEAINRALRQALADDERTIVLGQDVGKLGGVFRATDGLQAEFGAQRVFDSPLAESAIVGTAFGMALTGMLPITEIQFMGFIYKCLDQLVAQAGQIRARTWGQRHAQLVVRTAYGGGVRTPEHHSDSLEGLLIGSPGVKVVVPSTPADAAGLLLGAIADPDPVVVMEPIRLYRAAREEVAETIEPIRLGAARVCRPGDDVTLVAWGAVAPAALDAAEQLAADGVQVEVIDPRTLSPLDWDTLTGSVERTGRLVVAHEAPRTGGPGGEVVAGLVERCFYALRSPPIRVAGVDVVYPPQLLEDDYLPNVERIAAALRTVMED